IEACILISIDFEKAPLGSSIKVTLFFIDIETEFLANLYLTFHSWSPVDVHNISNRQPVSLCVGYRHSYVGL
uniref:hypothetical protein n=1 Tax=Hungatella hathewayi TaxID=154046 RepID=UPI0022E5283B